MSVTRHQGGVARRPPSLTGVQLGLGLTQLGRRWGVRAAEVPDEERARELLMVAVESGVRVFDTAPSYGRSEERLGRFLRTLPAGRRASLFVMTKCGEQLDASTGDPIVDHRYDSLIAGIQQSLDRLGEIDLLQVHRAGLHALRSGAIRRALAEARMLGVGFIGASVSDMESARAAVGELGVSTLQFPYGLGNTYMEEAFQLASTSGCAVIVNRSLGMGRLAYPDVSTGLPDEGAIADAYRFILERKFEGVVLTGTSSVTHLTTNLRCFALAASSRSP